MDENEMIRAAAVFIQADMEYVKLIEQAVHFSRKGRHAITDHEMLALHDAQKKRAVLEDQMYAIWDRHNIDL